MNTPVHALTLTPVVNRPQDKVMVRVASGSLPIASSTAARASLLSSSSSPSPATFTTLKCWNTGCDCSKALMARASFTPGNIHSV